MHIQELQKKLEKKFGVGKTYTLNGDSLSVATTKSGSIKLDKALGGGYPKGRIVEIYGPESSGKTTLALHAIAEVNKNGGTAAFIDMEHALDKDYALNLGCEEDKLIIAQPDYAEEALELIDGMIEMESFDIIVVDSVAALVPKAELEGEMGESKMGLQARLMSQAMRKLTPKLAKTNTVLIFINQLRLKIGVMFGNPEVTTGGNALKFYASQRLDVRKVGASIKNKDGELLGQNMKVKIVKNKISPPLKIVETELIYGEGINMINEVLDTCVDKGIVVKNGAWYAYDGSNFAQGKPKAYEFLKDNVEFYNKLVELCE